LPETGHGGDESGQSGGFKKPVIVAKDDTFPGIGVPTILTWRRMATLSAASSTPMQRQ